MLSNKFKKSVGAAGENAAAVYLVKKGYKILERNFLGRRFEIDIIAADQNGEIHFVEVKTRKDEKFGKGIDFVTPAKLNAIKRGALSYMAMLGKDLNMHFDVIEIYGAFGAFGFKTQKINMYKDVVG